MRFWKHRRARTALFLLLAVGYGFSAAHRQLNSGNDFPIYLDAARALLAGESPYSPVPGLNGYVYLPFFALLVSPLAFLPETVAIWVWYAVNVLLTVAAFRLTRALLEETIGTANAAAAPEATRHRARIKNGTRRIAPYGLIATIAPIRTPASPSRARTIASRSPQSPSTRVSTFACPMS